MRVKFFIVLSLLGLVFCFSGCASPELARVTSSGRVGFFDERSASGHVASHHEAQTHEDAPVFSPLGHKRHEAKSRPQSSPELVRSVNGSGLAWPLLSVQVTSDYGKRGRIFHEGVDLKALVGTPVYAAQSGKVLYSGSKIRGYGRMVVIRHDNGLATVYAHNSELLVSKGDRVIQGQRISLSGASGRTHGPHLHFETRRGVVALDPLKLLPLGEHAGKSVAALRH